MSTTAMIAFLPNNSLWAKQDFPHMTLVFAGEIADRPMSEFNDMGKDAISAARAIGSFSCNVTGVEQLGDSGEEVDALILYPTPQLLVARTMTEKWDQSGFPDFLPHVSIGPAGSAFAQQVTQNSMDDANWRDRQRDMLPSSIFFDRLAICWGDKRLIFSLDSFM